MEKKTFVLADFYGEEPCLIKKDFQYRKYGARAVVNPITTKSIVPIEEKDNTILYNQIKDDFKTSDISLIDEVQLLYSEFQVFAVPNRRFGYYKIVAGSECIGILNKELIDLGAEYIEELYKRRDNYYNKMRDASHSPFIVGQSTAKRNNYKKMLTICKDMLVSNNRTINSNDHYLLHECLFYGGSVSYSPKIEEGTSLILKKYTR